MTTIINHRDVGKIYAAWAVYLALILGSAGFIYWLQQRTPFNTELSLTGVYVCIGIAAVCSILALLFKYTFKREAIAWGWLVIVSWLGVGLLLVYGWNWWLGLFFIDSLVLLCVTGPYLYFE